MSYLTEDNVDFFSLLNNDDSDVNNIINENSNMCLISNTIIDKTSSIKLYCGHEFNYLPLYKEIIGQKVRQSVLEVVKLKDSQIKCPYCRNIQHKLIPYIKLNGVRKMSRVNNPVNITMCNNNCEYTFKSGKRKGKKCDSLCYFNYCNTHSVNKLNDETKSNNEIDYSTMTVKDLRVIAKDNSISKYYSMKKTILVDTIKKCLNKKNSDTK